MTTSEHADLIAEARHEIEKAGTSDGRIWYRLVTRLTDALASTPSPAQPTEASERITPFLHRIRRHLRQVEDGNGKTMIDREVADLFKALAPSLVQGAALSAEERGVIIDALIEHERTSTARKAVNSASNSDERAEMCKALIVRLGSPVQDADDRLALGEVLARVDEHDYCHERIREWEAQEQWEKDAHPDEAPSADLEDAEWWNHRADAALAWFSTRQQSPQAALNEVRAGALEEFIEAYRNSGALWLPEVVRLAEARAAELRAAPQADGPA